MKIRKPDSKSTSFCNIVRGEVFYYPANGGYELYMKMEDIEDSDYQTWNAVCLSNGNVESFAEDSSVVLVGGEYVRD